MAAAKNVQGDLHCGQTGILAHLVCDLVRFSRQKRQIMKASVAAAMMLMTLELCVTIATAYQHHSEARWEVAGAYFGTVTGYLLERLVVWIPLAIALLFLTWRCRFSFPIVPLALSAAIVEVTTTLGSLLFQDSQPSYGVSYGNFAKYFVARLALWIPLAGVFLWNLAWIARTLGCSDSSTQKHPPV